jgi:spermidine/putrescine transport system permease protein
VLQRIRQSRRLQLTLVLGPPALWVLLFLVIPYLIVLSNSFWTVRNMQVLYEFNLDNYARFFRSTAYYVTLLKSLRVAAIVTVAALALSYPLAYVIAFKVKRYKLLLYTMVVVPLWVSYLVRAYAWKTILGTDGILNGLLQWLHLTSQPVDALLYSPTAVILTLTHIYTPFCLMPIYAVMQQISPSLLEASQDLYASRMKTFFKVVLPLTAPGAIAGGTFAFVLALGDFIAPQLVGGPGNNMISNVIVTLYGAAFNWPLGSAVSIIMLLLVVGILSITYRLERRMGVSS